MAKVTVTVQVEIERDNGDYTKITRAAEGAAVPNPIYFAERAESLGRDATASVLKTVKDQFGDDRA